MKKILNILENEAYEEGMHIWMYSYIEKNDGDSKTLCPMMMTTKWHPK